ncbi:hypothetical protein [Geothrix fuzhouensis]|uniref:hypothetical protein n=1 Tax=Geothrix fuzhouensis TaxID=2966451 RepID=UPI002149139E|nr:hypothetical protein [Geothrix fuzhouensis]
MATKIMHVKSDGFLDSPLLVKRKDHDTVHFIQEGATAPSKVRVPKDLFEGKVTHCTVDPNADGTHIYSVVGKDGSYSVKLSATSEAMVGTGTIQVNG